MMDKIRNGNITSSEIVAITTSSTASAKAKGVDYGKPFYTYLEEVNMERRLGMALESNFDSKPTSWGKIIESRPFDQLPTCYTLCSDETLSHATIEYWKGSPDVKKFEGNKLVAIGDLKCPMTRKSFCQMVDPYHENGQKIYEGLTIEAVRANHPQGEKYYWQIVSNAIIAASIAGVNPCSLKGELIVYMPFKSELEDIRESASSAGAMSSEYSKWIYFANDDQLPHLSDIGYYQSINVIQFDIHENDVNFLIDRIYACSNFLTPWHKI